MLGLRTAFTFSAAIALGATAHVQTAAAADNPDVTLRMANWAGTAHHMYHYTLPLWFEEVKKQTDGRLEVIYDKVMLSKAPGLYDLARDGVRDIAWGAPSLNPGRFPLARFGEVPFGSPNATQGSQVYDEWYRKKNALHEREMTDVKFLFTFQPGPGQIHTKGTRVETMEDLQGLKLRASSGDVIVGNALGAVPVTLAPGQSYEAIQRGTVDGTFFPMEAVHSFRLLELVDYHILQPVGGLYSGTFYMVMNQKSYDGLAEDLREGFDKAAENGPRIIGSGWDEFDKRATKEAEENGNTFITISEEEAERWRETVYEAGTVEEIVGRAEKNGHEDAQELMDELLEMYGNIGS